MQHSDESTDGLFVEILKGALHHSNLNYTMAGLPWKRLIAKTDRAHIDASLPWRAKKERFEKYNMVGPITRHGTDTVFWARKDATQRFQRRRMDAPQRRRMDAPERFKRV
ncbi:hypothetical protein [Kiloniella sp.]|uniref:hypothetical protein n=1 Tax=Kiloniella sp. TaxID=1938587 RepID=UPI003B010561